ncbi:CAP domain-containing protein [Cohnella soli]|uniref:CAP domain-containing protein n=1 Tax=Cohnella soli TaxID=425005 RepID=A0ABW0HS49_9BACL
MKRLWIGCSALLLLSACGTAGKDGARMNMHGNMHGNGYMPRVSSVETTQPVNQQMIRSNDTLQSIADRFHVNLEDLIRANPNLAGYLNNPNATIGVGNGTGTGAGAGTGTGTGAGAGTGTGTGAGNGRGTGAGVGNGANMGAGNGYQGGAPQGSPANPGQNQGTVNVPANSNLTGYEQQVLELTNQERQKAGLSACAGTDANLNRSAHAKSEDMAAKGYFAHDSPTYGDPFAMMRNFGVQYQSAGENIAMGQPTPAEVVKAWMNSPGHRANILKGEYTHLGVGYVIQNGKAYWTQQFIQK